MNSKFFVPFETAKALKEKGYPQFDNDRRIMYGDDYYYDKDGVIANCGYGLQSIYGEDFKGAENDYVLAPTYHEVLDWLEGRGKRVLVDYFTYEDGGVWLSLIAGSYGNYATKAGEFKTREEALNAAILKALELI